MEIKVELVTKKDSHGTVYLSQGAAARLAVALGIPVFCNDGYFLGIIYPDGHVWKEEEKV